MKNDFRIVRSLNSGLGVCYICKGHGYNAEYMHKDGTTHSLCGIYGWFGSIEEAQKVLDHYSLQYTKTKNEFITKEEMII